MAKKRNFAAVTPILLMQILKYLGAAVVFCLLLFIGYFFASREYEVDKSLSNPNVRLLKNSLTETIRVVDSNSGQTILFYQDGFGVVLKSAEKLPDGDWKIVLQDHSRSKE